MIASEKLIIGGLLQGGIYVGDLNGYHIIASPKECGSFQQYKSECTKDEFATSISDGWKNTALMQEWNQDLFYVIKTSKVLYPAANYCRQLNIDGYKDWYLPSKDELNLLWVNRYEISIHENEIDIHGRPSEFAKSCWSSSELVSKNSGDHACSQYFGSGGQYGFLKTNKFFVRAVRRIPIQQKTVDKVHDLI